MTRIIRASTYWKMDLDILDRFLMDFPMEMDKKYKAMEWDMLVSLEMAYIMERVF